MHKKQTSYRSIVRGTAIFGGVQVFQMLVSLIRAKFIAVLLGPAGSGIAALLLTSTSTIQQFSAFGLNLSAVRDIATAYETRDDKNVGKIIVIFRRLLGATGLLGAVVCISFSKQLSELTFGSGEYRWAFCWLALTVLFNVLANGEIAIMQGGRKLHNMAKASAVGSLVGLLTSIPLYYWYGLEGIVPALLVMSISVYVINRLFSQRLRTDELQVSLDETLIKGKTMIKLGVVLMVSSVIGTLVTYAINAYISHKGGIQDVGLYQSGISITNQSLGLIFTSMGVDYFPRLSAVSNDRSKVRAMVNQQAEVVILVVTPIVVALIIFAPLMIALLFSKEYYASTALVQWISFGMIFKAASFAVGYISFAKGDKRTFFWLEGIAGNVIVLITNLAGYMLGGLTGLGISFLISYALYFIVVLWISFLKYGFIFEKEFYYLMLIQLSIGVVSLLIATRVENVLYVYLIGGSIFLLSSTFSLKELDKRIGIRLLLSEKFKRVS